MLTTEIRTGALIEAHMPSRLVKASEVLSSFTRLDASFYCGGTASTRKLLTSSAHEQSTLGEIVRIDQPTVFGKRFMQGTPRNGVPLYPASELLNHDPYTDTFLAGQFKERFECLMLKPGTLLLSRSGSVGRPVLVPPWLEGTAVQDDILKIESSDDRLQKYLYAYLISPIGQSLLVDTAFGSVIKHIKVDHVRDLPVLIPSDHLLNQISRIIELAQSNRERARNALISAYKQVYEVNKLFELTTEGTARSNCAGGLDCFWILAHDVKSDNNGGSEYRLDAHFYNPAAQLAVANIRKCQSEVKTVGDVAKEIRMSPLFVRKYVENEHGVPYIAGKQISQVRPEFKYISRTATEELDQHILHEGWTLITCAGSVGKVGYVSGHLAGAAAQDVMRVIPDESKVDGAYLNAWLASEYGRVLIERCSYGSVVDRVSPQHISSVLIPLPSPKDQGEIGDKVREAYEKRAEAIRLEEEAKSILLTELTKAQVTKGE